MDGMGKRILGILIAAVLLVTLEACRASGQPDATRPSDGSRLLLHGAGATFPFPLYSKWFDEYAKRTGMRLNYQSIGSGGGIKQISERTVDFGASDAPLTDEQLRAAPGELLHIPTVMGAVVIAYNLPGISSGLRLSPEALAGIFLGEITQWSHPRITAQNPNLKLPDQAMAVVYRSDGSGTTNIFTDYLSAVSPSWKSRVGKGTSVRWPVGIGGKGNEGVAGLVKQTPGAIGYLEIAYAVQNKLPYAHVQNREGQFVEPTLEATTAAAAGAAMPDDLRASIVNASGQRAYPISGYTYILVYKEQPDQARGKVLVDFLWWAIHEGESFAKDLLYAPLPPEVVRRTEDKIRSISYQGKPLLSGP